MSFGGYYIVSYNTTVSRKTYAKLFEAIGELWGAGDGSTTFQLPDADGRVMQGVTDVSKVGKYLEAGLPNITGSISRPTDAGSGSQFLGDCYSVTESGALSGFVSGKQANISNQDATYASISGLKFNASGSNSIYSGSTVQPSAFQILIIIKI